jgi:hypothetical protein
MVQRGRSIVDPLVRAYLQEGQCPLHMGSKACLAWRSVADLATRPWSHPHPHGPGGERGLGRWFPDSVPASAAREWTQENQLECLP